MENADLVRAAVRGGEKRSCCATQCDLIYHQLELLRADLFTFSLPSVD